MSQVLCTFLLACVVAGGCRSKAPRPSAERWAKIREWAKPTTAPGDDANSIARALTLLQPHEELVDNIWFDWNGESFAGVADDPRVAELPKAVDEAVDALLAWYEAKGGLSLPGCVVHGEILTFPALSYVHLGQAVMIRALREPESPAISALLYFGHRLRAEGKNLLHVVIGASIADLAVQWGNEHPIRDIPAFSRYRPSPELVIRAMATEVLCQLDQLELIRHDSGQATQDLLGSALPTPEVYGKKFIERQIDGVMLFHEETIFTARTKLNDDQALIAYLKERDESIEKQEQWLLLKLIAVPTARVLGDLAEHRTQYQALLDVRQIP